MKKILLTVVLILAGLFTIFYFKVGGYKSVTIQTAEEGPLKVVSKAHLGAFYKIVPVIEEVERWAKAHGETCRLSFGEFIDKPGETDEDRLRSNGGCIVEKDWSQGLPSEFTYRELPKRLYVTALFDGAPSIGPYKVYPKVFEYIEKSQFVMDGPIIETYEILPENKIVTKYYFPVRKP